MTNFLPRTGTIAYAKRASALWKSGERGVCYEVYQIGERPGYSFIFENGGYDGFSEDDLTSWLELTEEVAPSVVGFKFRNVMHLSGAYEAGRFAVALNKPVI